MKTRTLAFAAIPFFLVAGTSCAQSWPSKPIHIVVPSAAGTSSDALGRVLGQHMGKMLNQTVIIENKPGANGTIGTRDVARAAADGHTLLSYSSGHLANTFLVKDVPYDPLNDFTPVTTTLIWPQGLVVNTSLGVNNIGELTKLAKTSPGKLSFGAGAATARIGMELYKQLANVDILHVPYNGNAGAMKDLLGARIDMMVVDLALARPQIQARRLLALAVTGSTRLKLMPEVPTMAEAGVPGYELLSWTAIWAPAKLPPAMVARLSNLFGEVLASDPLRQFAEKMGGELFYSSPAEFDRFQRVDMARWRSVTSAAGIRPE